MSTRYCDSSSRSAPWRSQAKGPFSRLPTAGVSSALMTSQPLSRGAGEGQQVRAGTSIEERRRLALLLLPDDVAPHLVALFLQVGLGDDEAGVEQQLVRLLAGPQILESLEGHVDLEEQVLHA